MIRIKQRQHRQWILTIDVLYERTNSFLMFISCFLVLFHFIVSSAVQTRCVEAGVLTLAKQTEWEKKTSILALCLALCCQIYYSAVVFDK